MRALGGRGRTLALAAVVGLLTSLLTELLATAGARPAHALSTDPVPPELRVGRVLLLRPGRIDLAENGIVRRFVVVGPQVAVADLPGLVGDSRYVTWSRPGVIRLFATIAQRPGSVLVSHGSPVQRLELDETGPTPVRLVGTRATLRLNGTSIGLAGRATPRSPVVGTARYVSGSAVSLSNLAVTGLGDPTGRVPALEFSADTVATLTSVTIDGGGPGVRLDGTARADLTNVTVRSTRGSGVEVNGGRTLTIRGLSCTQNTGDGLRITGPIAALAVSDVVAGDNHGAGITLLTQKGGTLTRLRTTHNLDHGLILRAVSGATLDNVTSTGDTQPLILEGGSDTAVRQLTSHGTAVVVSGGLRLRLEDIKIHSTPKAALQLSGQSIVVRNAEVARAGEGIVVGAASIGVTGRPVTATGVTIIGGTFAGVRSAVRVTRSARATTLDGVTGTAPSGVALQVSGPLTRIHAGIWSGACGIRIRDQATEVTLDGALVSSSGPALAVPSPGVGTVTVIGTTLTAGGRKAVTSTARELTLRWAVVSGAALGVDLRGNGTLTDSTISATHQGLRVARGHQATLRRDRLAARDLGIEAVPGGSLLVSDSVVRASLASRGRATFVGDNDLSPRPLRVIVILIAGVLIAALSLETARRLREPAAAREVDAPTHVLNRT